MSTELSSGFAVGETVLWSQLVLAFAPDAVVHITVIEIALQYTHANLSINIQRADTFLFFSWMDCIFRPDVEHECLIIVLNAMHSPLIIQLYIKIDSNMQ